METLHLEALKPLVKRPGMDSFLHQLPLCELEQVTRPLSTSFSPQQSKDNIISYLQGWYSAIGTGRAIKC